MWPTEGNYQKLSLRAVRVQIRIGAYAHERHEPQTAEVDVELYRRYGAYRGEGLEGCLDYDPIYRYLTEDWPARGHVDLLEAWAEDLVGRCLEDSKVDACLVRIRKLEAYPGSAVAEIELLRHRRTP